MSDIENLETIKQLIPGFDFKGLSMIRSLTVRTREPFGTRPNELPLDVFVTSESLTGFSDELVIESHFLECSQIKIPFMGNNMGFPYLEVENAASYQWEDAVFSVHDIEDVGMSWRCKRVVLARISHPKSGVIWEDEVAG